MAAFASASRPPRITLFRAASLAVAGLMLAGLGLAFGFAFGVEAAMAACAAGVAL
jgi:hypothetical protein